MSAALLFKRFLQRPMQVAYIVPSSRVLVKRVVKKMDLSKPRVIVEYGPGEGCHTREIVERMHPDSKLLLFEIDPELAAHLQHQFRCQTWNSVLRLYCIGAAIQYYQRDHQADFARKNFSMPGSNPGVSLCDLPDDQGITESCQAISPDRMRILSSKYSSDVCDEILQAITEGTSPHEGSFHQWKEASLTLMNPT